MPRKKSYLTVTDQFCGAGGSSLGAVAAGTELSLGLNHWRLAIETHNSNFPDADHDCTDISDTDPRRYASTDILLSSPECTNHSLAKGKERLPKYGLFDGKRQFDPSAEKSRATAWDVPRFCEYHNYNIVIVENVPDFRKWVLFDAWWKAMNDLGYDGQVVYYNSQFAHPTPQSRDRMYVVFWKRGNPKPDLEFRPAAWCGHCRDNIEAVQSWKNPHRQWGQWGQRYGDNGQYVYRCPVCTNEVQPYYYCAANIIDWSRPGQRIGDRKRPLKERTMERIRLGLEKYAGRGMILPLGYTHGHNDRAVPFSDAYPTQTTANNVGMAMPFIMPTSHTQSEKAGRPVDEVLATQTARQDKGLITPPFMVMLYGTSKVRGIDQPAGAMTAGGINHGIVTPQPFLIATGGAQAHRVDRHTGVDEAIPTVTTSPRFALVAPGPFFASYYGTDTTAGVDEAMGTVTTVDRHGLVTPMPFFFSYVNGDGPAHGVDEPLLTICTSNGQGLVMPSEPPAVADCHFRMLQPHEIQAAMAFPGEYVVLGNKREQVRQLGNAVTPPVMQMLMERCVATLQ